MMMPTGDSIQNTVVCSCLSSMLATGFIRKQNGQITAHMPKMPIVPTLLWSLGITRMVQSP